MAPINHSEDDETAEEYVRHNVLTPMSNVDVDVPNDTDVDLTMTSTSMPGNVTDAINQDDNIKMRDAWVGDDGKLHCRLRYDVWL